MFSNTLVFSTLAVSLYATAVSADLTVTKPTALVQCANTTLAWVGGTGPYDVYVFTGCEDDNDDPIATIQNVAGLSTTWWVNEYSGEGVLVEVVDSTGASAFSDEAYVGGDASDIDQCKTKIKAVEAAASPSTTASGSGSLPTTASGAGDNGVANAEDGPTFSGSIATATPGVGTNISGASSISARPLVIVLGSVALGALAIL